MTEPIRIGVIGAGGNTRRKHIPFLLEQEQVEVVVVCNRSPESSQRVADEFNIPRIATDWKDVVQDPDVDAVMIGTWPYTHAEMTITALEAGKHVLCEARMAMNHSEAKAMLEASQAHPELITQIVPSPAAYVMDKMLNRLLHDEKVVGDILVVDLPSGGGFIDLDRDISWRDQRKYSGLNAMGLGIAYEAFARWASHAKTVEAHARIFVPERKNEAGEMETIVIPDHVDVFGELESGASYHIRCSRVTGANPNTATMIFGTTGSMQVFPKEKCVVHRPDGSTEEFLPLEGEIGEWRVEEEFIQAIRGIAPVQYTTFEDGVKYMAFTEAVMNAAGMA